MKIFMLIFCFVTISIEAKSTQFLPEKLIVSHSKLVDISQENLLKLKVYFIENPKTRVLKEKYNLTLETEILGEFHIVVIKPIKSLSLRSQLLIALSPVFSDIFYVNDDTQLQVVKVQEVIKTKVVVPKEKEENSLIDEIGLQWLALFCLSVIGLILSIRNRRSIATLARTQKDLEDEQEKIEKEINTLGVTND